MPAPHKIGLFTCVCLVVANMIGTGVFTSLGFQLQAVSQPFSVLLLWLLGGVFALCGALGYAELGGALPRSGGEYHFLGRIYHPSLGFMAGIVSLVAGFSAPVALAGLAFGQYLTAIFPAASPQIMAFALVTIVTAVHLVNLQVSSIFQSIFSVLKVVMVLGLAAAGFSLGQNAGLDWLPSRNTLPEVGTPAFAVSLMFALYAYSGWNAATYILGEIRQPGRTIGRALVTGTLLVMVLYLLLNASFLLAAPAEAYRGQLDVGRVAGEALFGPVGGKIVAGLVAAGLISAISAMMWAGPRVGMVMGEDLPAFRWLSRKSKTGIPSRAILLQYILVVLMLSTGSFEAVLHYTQVALVSCSALVVLGVIVLRLREPLLERPFRCWGYPVTPLLFLAISFFAVGWGISNQPLPTIAGLATMILAVLFYFALPGQKRADNKNSC
jgi:APA family basic amino acid/polyamine antiporter